MDLGQDLARYAIIHTPNAGMRYMVWTIHHVLYDGWSEPLILQQVSSALKRQSIKQPAPFKDFVHFAHNTDLRSMREFWRRELEGAIGPHFPRLPYRDYMPTPDTFVEKRIAWKPNLGFPFTIATIIRAAWAIVVSQYIDSDDILFGETFTGRDISLTRVEQIIGPLITTIPVRIRVSRMSSVKTYLNNIQQGIIKRAPYQHMGWQNIRKVSEDAQHACETGTGLVIQPEPEYNGDELGFCAGDIIREALHFNPYPLMLACGIRNNGFRVCANFDRNLVQASQIERMLAQLEFICVGLVESLDSNINDIQRLPEAELNQIWQWNQTPPLYQDEPTGRLRVDGGITKGSEYPRAAHTWVCDVRCPDKLVPIGCTGELWLESAAFSGENVESPAWLLKGSTNCTGRSGRLQATGDLVRLQEDGNLIFIGRKNDVLQIQGHGVDTTELEGHISEYMPSNVYATTALYEPLLESGKACNSQKLIVLIEQDSTRVGSQSLLPVQLHLALNFSQNESVTATTSTTISTDLTLALKGMHKYFKDILPPHLVPAAYVVLEECVPSLRRLNGDLRNQLASQIMPDVFGELRERFDKLWEGSAAQSSLTVAEKIMQSSWAKLLRLQPEKIDVSDNFFRLGGDSVLAMKLVSNLRTLGHTLTVADIFQNMRLRDAAKVLRIDHITTQESHAYKPFSLLGLKDTERFLKDSVLPVLNEKSRHIQDIYPVTDSQALDVLATINAPRTSMQYIMLYFDEKIEKKPLLHACNKLIKTHDILRTVFIEKEAKFWQVVLTHRNEHIVTKSAHGHLDQIAFDLCTTDTESDFTLGSTFSKFFHVEGQDGYHCLVLRLSHAQYDGLSLPMLLRDLSSLYAGLAPVDYRPFSSYIAQTYQESNRFKATSYWRNLLVGSSLSVLEGTSSTFMDQSIFKTAMIRIPNMREEITIANLVAASWAVTLARRLKQSDVTFGVVTSGRATDLARADDIVGPCYQIAPVRVAFSSGSTVSDLLQHVQNQRAESAAYDFLGFSTILKQCTQWSPDASFFDSVVHHHDVEDFETMPFAHGSCKVDLLSPHGDAAYPLKVVSFIRGERAHVGIVGSEKKLEFVNEILQELVMTVEELSFTGADDALNILSMEN